MANPMEMASPEFLDMLKKFDEIIKNTSAPVRPLSPQFDLIGKVDTRKIKEVMDQVWGKSDTTGGVRTDLANSVQSILDAKSYIGQGWHGDAFVAFNSAADEVKNPLDNVSGPLGELAESMKDMASKFDESVGSMMTTLSGFGGIVSAIGGLFPRWRRRQNLL